MTKSDWNLRDVTTPCLVVDKAKMQANLDRLASLVAAQPIALRPHLKTVKSIEAARFALPSPQAPATVSTLAEAERFGRAGFTDLLYAVAVSPQKLDRILELSATGVDLKIIVDSVEMAEAIAARARQSGDPMPTLIEIDVDDHRSGAKPDDADHLRAIAAALSNGATLHGVMTHAGESYELSSEADRIAAARQEAERTVQAATILRNAGHACPTVSVGSTPTAFAPVERPGVTELRAGVYMFFDLVQAGIGACIPADIALSVLTTIIGHQHAKNWIIVDAGWMALSRDRGTANQKIDQFYGMVCDEAGKILDDLVVLRTNQEHGVISVRPGTTGSIPDLPIGARLRILPNHACATAAQHDRYHVVGESGAASEIWPRFGGW